jgi:hypothetical protein
LTRGKIGFAVSSLKCNQGDINCMRREMAKKITRSRPWTKEEARMLKTLAREKTKRVIARKLNRSVDAMYRLASTLA